MFRAVLDSRCGYWSVEDNVAQIHGRIVCGVVELVARKVNELVQESEQLPASPINRTITHASTSNTSTRIAVVLRIGLPLCHISYVRETDRPVMTQLPSHLTDIDTSVASCQPSLAFERLESRLYPSLQHSDRTTVWSRTPRLCLQVSRQSLSTASDGTHHCILSTSYHRSPREN